MSINKTKAGAILSVVFSLLLAVGNVCAYDVIDDGSNGGEVDLYQIYNKIFSQQAGDPFYYASSDELYGDPGDASNGIGLADSDDNVWSKIGDEGIVKVTARYAGYTQDLAILPQGAVTPVIIVPNSSIPQNVISENPTSVYIQVEDEFVFVEILNGSLSGGVGPWYSDDRNSPRVDHFMAFDVTEVYNATRAQFDSEVDQAWMIAFEDLENGGDHDYNDLVAVVVNVDPIKTFAEEVAVVAAAGAGKVDILWTAASEEDVLGYNLLRKEGLAGPFVQVNEHMISAKGSVETTVDYEFADADVQNGRLYHYKLVEVETDGGIKIHAPVKAVPRAIYRILN